MIEKSEYATKYVFRERGVTGSLRKSNCQRFNIELGSNSITVRSVVLNLTVIYQRCIVNLTVVNLRYE